MCACSNPSLLELVSSYLDPSLQLVEQPLDRQTFLLHRITVAQRHRVVLHRLVVDRDAERGTDLVLAPIAPADGAGLIVLHWKVGREDVAHLLRLFRLPIFAQQW